MEMKGKPLFIRAEWDDEARVWVATSDDVPGLATEEESLEGLVEKLKIVIPELSNLDIQPTRFSNKPVYPKSTKLTEGNGRECSFFRQAFWWDLNR